MLYFPHSTLVLSFYIDVVYCILFGLLNKVSGTWWIDTDNNNDNDYIDNNDIAMMMT